MNLLKAFALAAVAFGMAVPAQAGKIFDLSFSGANHHGEILTGQARLTTDNGVADGADMLYTITGITGRAQYDWQTGSSDITGLAFFIDSSITGTGSAYTLNSLAFFADVPVNLIGIFNNGGIFSGFGPETSFASFDVTLNEGMAGAVPEPATWALMIGGFGLIGGAVRRRRRSEGQLAAA